jgi:UDP-glucose:(heptosyl)LPS alpha-1,3-glucosyltransferase
MSLKEITILKYDFNPSGGLEKQALFIAKAFQERGFRVSILTTKLKIDLDLKINFYYVKKFPFFSFLKSFYWQYKTSQFIKKNHSSIVLGLDRTINQTHIRAGNGVHKAFLNLRNRENFFKRISFYLNPLHLFLLYVEKKAFKNPLLKKIIVNSHMVKEELFKYYNIDEKKIEVIHNGVEWENHENDFYRGFEKKDSLLNEFNFQNMHHFLFCGNGYDRKGLALLLKAASLIKKDFHISIVGKDKDINKYKKLARSLNLEKKTSFFGYKNNLTSLYQICDTFVLPSYYDPFANTSLEALSFGLFNITSKTNGACEIINEKNGIILEKLNIDHLAEALYKAFDHPKTLKNAIIIRNSVKHLDIKNQLNKFVEALHE